MLRVKLVGAVLLTNALFACSLNPVNNHAENVIHCRDPRPQVCTMDYRPVCATRNNDDRTESATYANACGACADPEVKFFRPGPCEP